MQPPQTTPRADRFEIERRLDQVRKWIGLCRPTSEIVRDAMAEWGLNRRSVFNYLRKAVEQMAAANAKKIREQRAAAEQCYQALIDWSADRLETTVERTTITEAPGPDGKPVRRVTVTRQKILPAHTLRGALWARARLDKIAGLEKVKPEEAPVTLNVNWPVWCGNELVIPGTAPDPAPQLPEGRDDEFVPSPLVGEG